MFANATNENMARSITGFSTSIRQSYGEQQEPGMGFSAFRVRLQFYTHFVKIKAFSYVDSVNRILIKTNTMKT